MMSNSIPDTNKPISRNPQPTLVNYRKVWPILDPSRLAGVGLASFSNHMWRDQLVLYINDGQKTHLFGIRNDGYGLTKFHKVVYNGAPDAGFFNEVRPLAQIRFDLIYDAFRAIGAVPLSHWIYGWGPRQYVEDLLRSLIVSRLVYFNGQEMIENILQVMMATCGVGF